MVEAHRISARVLWYLRLAICRDVAGAVAQDALLRCPCEPAYQHQAMVAERGILFSVVRARERLQVNLTWLQTFVELGEEAADRLVELLEAEGAL